MFVVQKGVIAVQLYSDEGKLFREVILKAGDAIVLIQGVHSIRVIEDMQCISVKQGPFLEPTMIKLMWSSQNENSRFEPVVEQEEIDAVVGALQRGEISGNFGEALNEFETRFAEYCGCKYG